MSSNEDSPSKPRRPGQQTQSIVKQNEDDFGIGSLTLQEEQAPSSDGARQEPQPTFQQMTLPKATNLSVFAQEFVPQSKTNAAYGLDQYQNLPINDSYNSSKDAQEGNILQQFTNALNYLNYRPGNLREFLKPVCERIVNGNLESENTEEIMNDMVESLFEQSIEEPNFRYTGAKICQYLSTNLQSNTYFSGFQQVLMKRCLKDYDKREELLNGSEKDQARLRGLAMFMAEILLNVEIPAQDYLPKILTDFVHTLLSHPTEQEVKCSCQLLKLSGALIEDVAKNDPSLCEQFEEIFTLLSTLSSRNELSSTTKILAGSVIQLKDQNWNRVTTTTPGGFSNNSGSSNFQQEAVFYNNMGIPYSRDEGGYGDEPENVLEDSAYVLNDDEEAAYLAWQAEAGLGGDPELDELYFNGYVDDENGMGEEEFSAYEEFLKQQGTNYPSQGGHSSQMPHHDSHSNYSQHQPHHQAQHQHQTQHQHQAQHQPQHHYRQPTAQTSQMLQNENSYHMYQQPAPAMPTQGFSNTFIESQQMMQMGFPPQQPAQHGQMPAQAQQEQQYQHQNQMSSQQQQQPHNYPPYNYPHYQHW